MFALWLWSLERIDAILDEHSEAAQIAHAELVAEEEQEHIKDELDMESVADQVALHQMTG